MTDEIISNTVPRGGPEDFPPILYNEYIKNYTSNYSENDVSLFGVEFFDRPASDVVETRQECRVNNFPNTEFALYRRSKEVVMFFGESWSYGGKIRDMVVGNEIRESVESVIRGIVEPVGPKMSQLLDCDLYQSAWPGDHTTNMFEKAERILPEWVHKYNEVKLCIQITDPHRCANACHLYDTPFINKFTNDSMTQVGITAEEWLYEYDKSFLVWADEIIQKYNNVDIVLWKNFNPWCISKDERSQYKTKTQDLDWTTFNSQLDGVELLEGRQISNPALMLRQQNCMMSWVGGTPVAWKDHQIKCIEDVQNYWNDISFQKLKMNVNYPSPTSHRLWAMQLITAGGWK
jgi:hypothetical protein